MTRPLLQRYIVLLAPLALQSCSGGVPSSKPAQSEATVPPPGYEAALPEHLRQLVSRKFTGDLNAMIQRRIIRIAAPFNRTYYFLDGGEERGLSYEYAKLFEKQLNEKLGKGRPAVYVILLPMPRDALLPALNDGRADLVVAQLTITPERQRLVDFTNPTRANVNEILVSGGGSTPVSSAEGLSGKQVFVRKSSSYYQSLFALNQRLQGAGKAPVDIQEAPENLEDDDLLEMVNAGLIPATVVDDYLAQFWKKVFPNLVLSEEAPLRTGGRLAAAIRKNSPELKAALDTFIAKNGLDTALGAILNKRYLQNAEYVKNAAADTERRKYLATVDLFRKYGQEYDFDYLMMAAQGYQESRLDQAAKSPVGAIGVMQLKPETGKEQNVGDISQLEPNIHAGVKYMRFTMDRYYAHEPMDRVNKELFTFASYNAGPGKIRQMRKEAASRGLNPNIWFGNVEQVVADRVGSEPVTYVSDIYKYYIAYRLITDEEARREAAKKAMGAKRAG
jgi:membrane-bound lytic murein transglycosylase MltF